MRVSTRNHTNYRIKVEGKTKVECAIKARRRDEYYEYIRPMAYDSVKRVYFVCMRLKQDKGVENLA